jgi:hypothetical protein
MLRNPKENAQKQDAPEQNESSAPSQCSLCGHHSDLVELPGIPQKYCPACSADVATTILLKTEITAAWLSGQRYENLAAELAQLSERLLARAQSA